MYYLYDDEIRGGCFTYYGTMDEINEIDILIRRIESRIMTLMVAKSKPKVEYAIRDWKIYKFWIQRTYNLYGFSYIIQDLEEYLSRFTQLIKDYKIV